MVSVMIQLAVNIKGCFVRLGSCMRSRILPHYDNIKYANQGLIVVKTLFFDRLCAKSHFPHVRWNSTRD